MSCRIFQAKRNAKFTQPLKLEYEGFNWTDVRVRVQLKESVDGPVITTFDTNGGDSGTSFTMAITSAGIYEGSFEALEWVTRDWPDNLIGDIWVYRGSPVFGPYILAPFALEVSQNITES